MQYKCLHCNYVFELGEKDFQRCPNCFWTTSLVEEGNKGQTEIETPPSSSVSSPPKTFFPIKKWLVKGAAVLSGAVLLFAVLFFAVSNQERIWASRSKWLPLQASFSLPRLAAPSATPASSPRPARPAARDPKTVLSREEHNDLMQMFQLTIPRPLTPDEEEILKKQVSFPVSLAKTPSLLMWTKDDFEEFLESEQKKRKIPIGFWYERQVKKTFREHYLAATSAFKSGHYAEVRDELLRSLAFPVYQNNLERYRAVVLVMLRPFINDVLGKLAVLNQYLINQTLVSQAEAVYQSYQALAPVLDLHEWEKAASLISSLKHEIASFEAKAGQVSIPASPALSIVDPEIRAAIERETTPPEGAAVNLRTLSVDLDLKEKVVRQNMPEALTKVQKEYEDAIQLLRDEKWGEAREKLRAVEYPPELVQDAKKKIALIDKLLAA